MFGITVNFKALFQTNPIEQIQNTVRKLPLSSLVISTGALVLSLSTDLPSLINAPLMALSLTHIAAFVYEYKRLIYTTANHHVDLKEGNIIDDDNKKIAELKFIKNVDDKGQGFPILYVESQEPELIGKAIARAVHEPFIEMMDRYYSLMNLMIRYRHYNTKDYQSNPMLFVSKRLRELNYHYPKNALAQLKGFVDEMNRWIRIHNQKFIFGQALLHVNDMLTLTSVIDVMKLLACTAGVKEKKLLRNLDWASLDVLTHIGISFPNTTSKENKSKRILSIGFVPGFMHVNICNEGIVAVLNEVARTSTQRRFEGGTPKFYYLFDYIGRKCLSIDDIKKLLDDNIAKHKPASSHTLTVWERNTGKGCIFQILPPGRKELYIARELTSLDQMLATTNHHIDLQGNNIKKSETQLESFERYNKFMADAKNGVDDETLLNNAQQKATVQQLIFSNQPEQYQCKIRWGQSFKTLSAPVTLPIDQLLGNKLTV